MSTRYSELIALHNTAIDILSKRNDALEKLEEAETRVERWESRNYLISSIHSLEELKWDVNKYRRYISLLSKAYAKLAFTVCTAVSEQESTVIRNVITDLSLAKDWEVVGEGSIKPLDNVDNISLFDLLMAPVSNPCASDGDRVEYSADNLSGKAVYGSGRVMIYDINKPLFEDWEVVKNGNDFNVLKHTSNEPKAD